MDFKTFKNKYIITGRLVVKNALHIGSGKENEEKDAPFITLSENRDFYIPGSSFRGYLSAKLERLLDRQNNFKLKDKNSGDKLNEADVKLIFGYTNLDKESDDDIKSRILKKLQNEGENIEIEDIKSMAGKIHVSDMPVISDIESVTRDGIKIDRNLGSVEEGAKFNYDVVPAGTEFEVRIELENIEKYQLDLLGLAFKDIMSNEGDLFGGKTSRGIGKCKVKDLTLSYITAENIDELKRYIFKGIFPKEEKNYKFSTENLDMEIEG